MKMVQAADKAARAQRDKIKQGGRDLCRCCSAGYDC